MADGGAPRPRADDLYVRLQKTLDKVERSDRAIVHEDADPDIGSDARLGVYARWRLRLIERDRNILAELAVAEGALRDKMGQFADDEASAGEVVAATARCKAFREAADRAVEFWLTVTETTDG